MAHLKKRTVGGEARYDICWREHGKNRSRTFLRVEDARRFKTETERRMQLGSLYDAPDVMLAAARADWRERWKIGKAASTVARMDVAWQAVEGIGRIPIGKLSPAAFEDEVHAIAQTAPRQAQMAAQQIRMVLRDARSRGHRFQPELLEVRAPDYDERQPVFLGFQEVDELASWCSMPHLIVVLAYGGFRIGEALALRDTEVDREARAVMVVRSATNSVEGRTKTRKQRRVVLPDIAWQALLKQLVARPANANGLVFPTSTGKLWNSANFRTQVFGPAVKAFAQQVPAGRRETVARLTCHDLRHTAASLMISVGLSPWEIAETLGHSDKNGRVDPTLVLKRYGHLHQGSAERVAQAFDRHLGAAVV